MPQLLLNQRIFIAAQALLLTKGKTTPLTDAMPALRNVFNEKFQTPLGPEKDDVYVRRLVNDALKGQLGQDKRTEKAAAVLNPEKLQEIQDYFQQHPNGL